MTGSEDQPVGQLFVGKGKASPLPFRRPESELADAGAAGKRESGRDEPGLANKSRAGKTGAGKTGAGKTGAGKIGAGKSQGTAGASGKKTADSKKRKMSDTAQRQLFDELPDAGIVAGREAGPDPEPRAAASLLPLEVRDPAKRKKLDLEFNLPESLPVVPEAVAETEHDARPVAAAPKLAEADLETSRDKEAVAESGLAVKADSERLAGEEEDTFSMVLPAGAKALSRRTLGGSDDARASAVQSSGDATLAKLPDRPDVLILPEDRLNRKKAILAAALAAVTLLTAVAAYLLWGRTGTQRHDLLVAREIVAADDNSPAAESGSGEVKVLAPPPADAADDTGQAEVARGADAAANSPDEAADAHADAPATDAPVNDARDANPPAADAIARGYAAAKQADGQVARLPETAAGVGALRPSIDEIDVNDAGYITVSGNAAPEADVILLDNNEPIGTATANESGTWQFKIGHKLPPGMHTFGLVAKDVDGRVILGNPITHEVVPPAEPEKDLYADLAESEELGQEAGSGNETSAYDAAANPQDDGDSTAATPVPPPKAKPAVPAGFGVASNKPAAAQEIDYVIQLASVTSREGAEQEWSKMVEAHKSLLRPLTLIVDSDIFETKFRVRTGPFENGAEATEICKALKSRGQDCLVVKRVDGYD